jgi:hypothetical protein
VLSDCPKNNNTATRTPQLTTTNGNVSFFNTLNGSQLLTRMSTSVSPMTETKEHGLLITLFTIGTSTASVICIVLATYCIVPKKRRAVDINNIVALAELNTISSSDSSGSELLHFSNESEV